MDLMQSLKISAAGMKVQGQRLRVLAENLANADSVAEVPGGDPYRRKTISFKNALDANRICSRWTTSATRASSGAGRDNHN